MRAQTWRGMAAGSSVLMALAVLWVYWRFVEIPFVNFIVASGYRSFLLVFPAMASCALLLWGVASFRLKAGFWRYSLAVISGLSAAGIVILLATTIARGGVRLLWAVPLAFMPAVLFGMQAWILWSKRTSFRWGRVIVYLVAALLLCAPALAFLANAYSWQAGLKTLGLAALPFGLVVLAFLIGRGRVTWSLVNLAILGVVGGLHLYWTVRGMGRLGRAFGSTTASDLAVAGIIAAVALIGALVNWKAFRRGRGSG